MPSMEARLRSLEQSQCLLNSAQQQTIDAIDAGTATLAQYQEYYSDEIREARDMFLARIPWLVAVVRSGLWLTHTVAALAYPPDCPLPDKFACTTDYEWLVCLDEQAQGRATPRDRALAGAAYLAAGGGHRDALPVREEAWVVDGNRWRLSPRVIELATTTNITASYAYKLDTRDIVSVPTEPTTPAGNGRTYADEARTVESMGWQGRHDWEWSDQVRSGQHP